MAEQESTIADDILLGIGEIKGELKNCVSSIVALSQDMKYVRDQSIENRLISKAAHKRIDTLTTTVNEHAAILNQGKGGARVAGWLWGTACGFVAFIIGIGINFFLGH